jgi:hypothetical protein
MITKKVGQAMATTVTRHNTKRQQKLQVFYAALKAKAQLTDEEKVIIKVGFIRGKKAEIFLLNNQGRVTLNLTLEGKTFKPLFLSDAVNEGDYLAWNAAITKEIDTPTPKKTYSTYKPQKTITNPKSLNVKAKTHDVTPLDNDTFRVKSGTSGNEYFVRLLPDVEGGMCNCAWGQRRKRGDNYRSACSHVQAVYKQWEGFKNRTTTSWASKEDAKRQHRPVINIGDGVTLTSRKR